MRRTLVLVAAFGSTALSTEAAVRFYAVTPCRLLDTRESLPLAAGETRAVVLAGRCAASLPPTCLPSSLGLALSRVAVSGSCRDAPVEVQDSGVYSVGDIRRSAGPQLIDLP